MRLDLYLQETARLAERQGRLLEQATRRLQAGESLSELEQNGVLHALQVLTENAIGKAKQLLKANGSIVPLSAYDAFRSLAECGRLPRHELDHWNAIVGLRNRIVHDYLNIDFEIIQQLLIQEKHNIILRFLVDTQQG